MDSETNTKKSQCDANKKSPFKGRLIHQGLNVQLFRNRAGLSQAGLAQKIGKTQQFISNIEQQEVIDPDTVSIIAQALEIDPQYITEWTSDNSMNIFNIDKMGEGEGSTNMVGTNNFETNHEVYIYPIDKVCELYERMLEQKDKRINELQSSFDDVKKEIREIKESLKK